MKNPDTVQHFCDDPKVALCGADLMGTGDFRRFYKNCTSCFADITCDGCRAAVYEQKLKPAGFPYPEAWTNKPPRRP